MKSLLVSAAATLVAASAAFGQTRTVSDIHVTLDEWEFVPTLVGTQVESFVGLRDPADALGSNITSVWFVRTSDQDWQALAWHEPDNVKSIAHVKGTLGLDDSTDENWPDPAAQQGVDPSLAEDPDAFGTGVFEADPFSDVIELLPEPGAMIDMLTDSGWSAATIAIQTGTSPCTQNEILSGLAAMVEADIATGAGGSLVAGFTIPQTKCGEWVSLAIPLAPDGTWAVWDFTDYLQQSAAIDPADAWQSRVPGTVITGPQTIVVDAGGTDTSGQPFLSSHFVVTVKDATAPETDLTLESDVTPHVSFGGLVRFVAPATVQPAINVDDAFDPSPSVELLLNGEPHALGDPVSAIGFHVLSVRATDESGNTSESSAVFEIRERPSHTAAAVVEETNCEISADGQTGSIAATILVSSSDFDHHDILLSSVGVMLRS